MKLSAEDIAGYKQLCKLHYDAEVDDEAARKELTALVRLMELVYRPITAEQQYEMEANVKLNPVEEVDV